MLPLGSIKGNSVLLRGLPLAIANQQEVAMALSLVIANKNYSSWSFRPWIAMKVAGIGFEETVIPLREPGSKELILSFSPAGKVPILIDGDVRVWESLAILEYLAEQHPQATLWPSQKSARSHARALAAEMHAGFVPLRRLCPMNMWRPVKQRELTPEVMADVRRIDSLWTECRSRFGGSGPFLCGNFGVVDAMYAPIVSRFHTYDIAVGAASRAYMQAVMALPAWSEWRAEALKEAWVLPEDEVDWPIVTRE
jgi:glutathione S-transferase